MPDCGGALTKLHLLLDHATTDSTGKKKKTITPMVITRPEPNAAKGINANIKWIDQGICGHGKLYHRRHEEAQDKRVPHVESTEVHEEKEKQIQGGRKVEKGPDQGALQTHAEPSPGSQNRYHQSENVETYQNKSILFDASVLCQPQQQIIHQHVPAIEPYELV